MKRILTILFLAFVTLSANCQLAVKTNLLCDATTTPNIGAELRVGSRSTINLVYGLNPFSYSSKTHGERKVKHWVIMPEYRYWLCVPYNGHFIGAHLLGGQMNASNVSLPVPGGFFGGDNLTKEVREHRYQGEFAGIGVTYGYQWNLAEHWNLEAEIGAGYGHVWYDKYSCEECEGRIKSGTTNYLGITKLGISLLYIF